VSGGTEPSRNRRTGLVLGAVVVGMFGFGFALVPLYSLFCQVTGVQSVKLNAARDRDAAAPVSSATTPSQRVVTVKFDATVNSGLPWEFKPLVRSLEVHPGEAYEVRYLAHNVAAESVVGQAIAAVVPWQATAYFHKTECFCFRQQTLAADEAREMPLRFVVSPDLPEGINTLTLSYTFMNTDPNAVQHPVGIVPTGAAAQRRTDAKPPSSGEKSS
jgi:cytochrome c oxidase assembly protein subunit 11